MSTVFVITPLVVANWAAIVAAVSVVAKREAFVKAQERARKRIWARRLLRGKSTPEVRQAESAASQNSAGRAEIDLAESEILPAAAGTDETLVIERDGVRATFSRDARGALKLCVEGPHLSKAELKAIGESLIGKVTQQYAYDRIMSELKERRLTIVGEEVSPDQSVKIRVRNH